MPVIKKRKGLLLFAILQIALVFSIAPNVVAQVESTAEYEYIQTLKDLAWNNYAQQRINDLDVQRKRLEVRQRRLEWFNAFTFSYMYYPDFLNREDDQRFAPLGGIGLTVNIGQIISVPGRVRDARYEVDIARANRDLERTRLNMEVINRYGFVKQYKELAELHSEAVENTKQFLQLVRRQFEEGEALLEDYQRATDAYMEDARRLIVSRNDLLKAKLELEELIGTRLEEVR